MSLTVQNRIGQEELHLSQQETRGENVSAIKLHTWKDDKHRQDSTAVVQGERPVGVTELPQSIRLLHIQLMVKQLRPFRAFKNLYRAVKRRLRLIKKCRNTACVSVML